MKPVIKIDVVSDVVCPWCYIGKRRLEKALDQLSAEFDFDVQYHPFELNPDMPAAGRNHKEYLSEKFGSEARYDQLTQNVTNVAASDGLAFHYEKQQVSPNTRLAHSLIAAAQADGNQTAVVEALFKAYFTDGVDLSKSENLVAAVAGVMDKARAEAVLADVDAKANVEKKEREMYAMGISGVPFYIINNKYGVSGAQAADTFVQAFREIGLETAGGESCDVDGKNC